MSKSFLSALFKKSRGFTLVELMVVVAIMMIMTAVVIVNYRPGNQQLALNRSASKLAQDIRRAQEMAMSSAECPPGTGCAGQVPPRYGIYSASAEDSPTSYLMFADENNDGSWFPAHDKEVDELDYESGVFLSSIMDSTCDDWPPGLGIRRPHITFSPPDPTTELRVGFAVTSFNCTEIVLTLQVIGVSGLTKKVIINNAGLIYVE